MNWVSESDHIFSIICSLYFKMAHAGLVAYARDYTEIIIITFCVSSITWSIIYAHFYAYYETLFSTVWHMQTKFKKYLFQTYMYTIAAICITSLTSNILQFVPTILNFLFNHIRSYIIISYVILEILIRKTNSLSYETEKRLKIVYFTLCSMMAGPFVCFFGQDLSEKAGYYTLMYVVTLAIVSYTLNESLHVMVLQNLSVSFLIVFIPVSLATTLLLGFGYPKNIFGLTLVIISLQCGFLVYSFMYILSTHLLVFSTLKEPYDPIFGAVDNYLCYINLYFRILFYMSFTFNFEVTTKLNKN